MAKPKVTFRKLVCSKCYHPMEVQMHLHDSGYTATCVHCPHVVEYKGRASNE